jgi:3-oxoacyl-(acyl-carrier-protein) synthase
VQSPPFYIPLASFDLQSADIAADKVGYVNAHATSTPTGDLIEARAIWKMFSHCDGSPPVSSTKVLFGGECSTQSKLYVVLTN